MQSDTRPFQAHSFVLTWAEVAETMARHPPPISLSIKVAMGFQNALNPPERTELIARAAGLPLRDKYMLYLGCVMACFPGPLYPYEEKLSGHILQVLDELGIHWFHGGEAGLITGDDILPPSLTGAETLRGIDRQSRRPSAWGRYDFAWITPKQQLAWHFATKRHDPAVYRVLPKGNVIVEPTDLRVFLLLELDPEVTTSTVEHAAYINEVRCTSAEVVEVWVSAER